MHAEGASVSVKIQGRKDPAPINPLMPMPEPPSSEKKVEEVHAVSENAVSVDLSESSRNVTRAREAIAVLPEIRVEKVAELKEAIEDGSYQVESEKVARKMVDEALRESARQKRNGR